MLVVISCALMAAAGLALAGRVTGIIASILVALILLDILGTSVAVYFLQTPLLFIAPLLAAIGWVMRAIGHAADSSIEVA